MGDGEEVELAAVVVGREPRGLLVGVGREGRGAGSRRGSGMLLPARDQRLLEPAADRLAAVQAQRGGRSG